jgi:hypothetical protein
MRARLGGRERGRGSGHEGAELKLFKESHLSAARQQLIHGAPDEFRTKSAVI